MFKRKKYKNNISKTLLLLYLTLSSILFFFIFSVYKNLSDNINQELKDEGACIANVLEEILDLSSQLVEILGKQVNRSNTTDINVISSIISLAINENENLAWLNLGWIDANNMYVYDFKKGLIDPPISLSERGYVQKCNETPEKFYTSQVVMGAGTGIRKIPGGIGIINSQKKYLGTLCAGMALVDLKLMVQKKLKLANFNKTTISYLVLDEDFHKVLQSWDTEIDMESPYYKDDIENNNIFMNVSGLLSKPIVYNEITYTHYQKINGFPYYILTGLNHKKYFFMELYPYIRGIITVILLYVLMIYIHRKEQLKNDRSRAVEKDKFLNEIINIAEQQLQSMLQNCELVIKSLDGEIEVGISEVKRIEILGKVYNNIFNLIHSIGDSFDNSLIDINQIVRECIRIHNQKSKLYNTQLNFYYYSLLPPFNGDQICIKRIVYTLISLCIELPITGERNMVNVYTGHCSSMNNREYIEIIIESNSFALNRTIICNIQSLAKAISGDPINLSYETVEKLVRRFEGTINIISDNKNKRIVLKLPYAQDNQASNNESNSSKMSNVINLSSKTIN